MSNARDVAQRLVNERADGTASKDPDAWMAEASITLQRLLDEAPPADVVQAASSLRQNGYRGPLTWARKVIDWVASHE